MPTDFLGKKFHVVIAGLTPFGTCYFYPLTLAAPRANVRRGRMRIFWESLNRLVKRRIYGCLQF